MFSLAEGLEILRNVYKNSESSKFIFGLINLPA